MPLKSSMSAVSAAKPTLVVARPTSTRARSETIIEQAAHRAERTRVKAMYTLYRRTMTPAFAELLMQLRELRLGSHA